MQKFKYLLFDLDGTLIKFDLETFIKQYLLLIEKHFSDKPFAHQVPKWILQGTDLMLNNNGSITNREKFLKYFKERSGMPEQEIWHRFLQFYQTDFNQIKKITRPVEQAARFLEVAVEKGYTLVLATQPVFPTIAIKQRLNWSGIDQRLFHVITDIELMNACKPSEHYYRQLLDILGTTADHCLMIGNDIETDLAAKKVGIETFYIDSDNKSAKKPQLADYVGDFYALAQLFGLSIP